MISMGGIYMRVKARILFAYYLNDIQIIKEFQIGEDNKSIATLKKNMCNKATLELVRRIKENFMK